MDVNTLKSVYFIGAGGIGMSALVRYFLSKGKKVGGYDRTPSELTEKLIEEGAAIHYEENTGLITDAFRNPATTLVVYTPAVPDTHKEFTYFRENGFRTYGSASGFWTIACITTPQTERAIPTARASRTLGSRINHTTS